MTPRETMLYWVREREAVRVRKESGKPLPWTTDPILRDWRFCNVRREDDRVTRWIDENIRRRFKGHPYLWFMLCAARQLNWPPTLAALMNSYADVWPSSPSFSPAAMADALDNLASKNLKVFTGAYIVTAPATKGVKKTRFVAERTLGALWQRRESFAAVRDRNSMRSAHRWLTGFNGWGPFLAYQAVVDMRFCPSILASATDVHTWAAAGPGTIRGLNRLSGRSLDAPLHQEVALAEMLPIYESLEADTGVEVDLSDVPNVMCEVDKYLRVKNGEGTPRARYIAGRGS